MVLLKVLSLLRCHRFLYIDCYFTYCVRVLFPRLHPDGTKLRWLPSQMAEDGARAGVLQRGAHQSTNGEGSLGGQTKTRPQPSRRGDPAETKGRGWLWEAGMLDQMQTPFVFFMLKSALLFLICGLLAFSIIQDRQIQLIRDLLTSEGSSNSIQLSAEQRSALAFLSTNCQPAANLNTSRR